MKKTELISTDQRKFNVLISEKVRFCKELNDGLELLKGLPFVEPEQCPTLKDLKDPVGWWDNKILEAISPKPVKGFPPDPGSQARSYRVDYDQHVKEINLVPWVAMDMVEFINDHFEVTPQIEQKVRESASIFATPAQAAELKKLDVLLEGLNEYCSKYVTDKMAMNAIADGLLCKYVQLPDKTRVIISNPRAFIIVMERVALNS